MADLDRDRLLFYVERLAGYLNMCMDDIKTIGDLWGETDRKKPAGFKRNLSYLHTRISQHLKPLESFLKSQSEVLPKASQPMFRADSQGSVVMGANSQPMGARQ